MPEGGQEEGSEERGRWEKGRSNELLPGLGCAEGKHVDECAGEYRRVTSGLHYKRKALQGCDPIGTCEGAAVLPARNKGNNTSGDCAQAVRSMPASRLRALLKSKELYSHIACFMSSPSLAWMKCSLYFGSARARLQKNSHNHAGWKTIWRLFSP